MSGKGARGDSGRRKYRLGKRAELQQETRRRIVEATVDLHGTIGPLRTTVSQIAERAGVQRHTYYAHFPDERGLYMACSGLALERDPLPDIGPWALVPAGTQRVKRGLEEIYCWYARNEGLLENVLRDAEQHPLTREMIALRVQPTMERAAELLGEGLDEQGRILLDLAIDFACWRKLARSLSARPAAELMTQALARFALPCGE